MSCIFKKKRIFFLSLTTKDLNKDVHIIRPDSPLYIYIYICTDRDRCSPVRRIRGYGPVRYSGPLDHSKIVSDGHLFYIIKIKCKR